ncbi:MAG TPA: hypothetical protein VK735_47220 [Pseudonocardia sp.]|jgi:hypothetical protein|uniref:hypothetical protein n=1 Tax=Pseudonocardia sp. TaxID=60912 RepID=UPI002B8DD8F3|nr:hypothetical protein [Pseudonocardia sp.]HTF55086.1 hypothetical protein [Pseudonocardia sp.]
MTSPSTTDPTVDRDLPAQADQPGSQPITARFPDGSRELVEELRSRLASHDAASARRRESLAVELARQESLWAANEETRLRQLAVATREYETARGAHDALAATATTAAAELYAASCRAAALFKAAVRAERAKRDAMPALEAARRKICDLAGDTPDPSNVALHEFDFKAHDPRLGISQSALEVFPELRRELAQLRSFQPVPTEQVRDGGPHAATNGTTSSTPCGPPAETVTGSDQLDIIFRKSQAKRDRDDETRQVPLRT